MKRLGLGGLTILSLLLLVLFVPKAKADSIDFSCSQSACAPGAVTVSGANFTGTGISTLSSSSPAGYTFDGDPFTLAFNTSTGAVSLTGTGAAAGEDFVGTINSFSVASGGFEETVTLNATWAPLPAGAQSFFPGSTGGADQGQIGFVISGGAVNSVDVTIFPTPEPGLLGLLCSGLVGVGLIGLRRRELVA